MIYYRKAIIMSGFSIGRNQVICIPCEFVDYFMKDANPTFIAVYIYGYRQCFSEHPKSTAAEVASALSVLESDVVKAWRYWESRGVVSLTYNSESDPSDFSVEFNDLSGLAPKSGGEEAVDEKPVRPTYKMSEIAERKSEDKTLSEMYSHAELLLDRPLSANDTTTLYGLYDWLGLPVEVILMILEHCVSLGKKSMRYVEAVALSWYDMGLCTAEKASAHIEALGKVGRAKRRFKKLLGISGRDISDTEYHHLVEWSENMGFSDEMIKLAYEKTVMNTGKASFNYMHAILKNWHDTGIKTVDAATHEAKSAPKIIKSNPAKTRFSSYSERGTYSDEDIDRIMETNAVTLKSKN